MCKLYFQVVETERVNDLRDVRCELYPRMPKLTNLFVSEVNLFAISSESLTQERLPSLKNVTLKSTQINEFPIKILDSQNLIVGSKYLSISPVPTGVSDIWKEVATIFPNLRKLSVGCTSYYKDDPPTPAAVFMKNTLNLIGFLLPTLEELSIHLKFSCTLEELMNAIWAKGFRGKGEYFYYSIEIMTNYIMSFFFLQLYRSSRLWLRKRMFASKELVAVIISENLLRFIKILLW